MRIYNPSLGRFLSVDPITDEYPELTPYQFASNTPIQAIDLDGLECAIAISPEQMEILKNSRATRGQLVTGPLTVTDANDISVIVTTISRNGKGVNIDGTKATKSDKIFALGGLMVPVVSGSLIKKGLKGGFEMFQQSFRFLNWTEKTYSAYKGAWKGALRTSLIKAGLDLTGKEAHHLIPKELLVDNKVVQDAVEGGFDFNGVINGMIVNKGHGPHKNYTEQILGKIDEWKQANPDYSPADAKEFLTDLSGQAREAVGKAIKDGKNVGDAVLK
jgi:hypothetical protein